MKLKIKAAAALAAIAFLTVSALGADNLRSGNPVMSYVLGNGYYFSIGGTNGAAGYTNTAVHVWTPGTVVSTFVSMKGFSVNFSNTCYLTVTPAYADGAAYSSATNVVRYPLTAHANNTVVTNIVMTGWAAPGMRITVENPVENPVSITNLTVNVFSKVP